MTTFSKMCRREAIGRTNTILMTREPGALEGIKAYKYLWKWQSFTCLNFPTLKIERTWSVPVRHVCGCWCSDRPSNRRSYRENTLKEKTTLKEDVCHVIAAGSVSGLFLCMEGESEVLM